MQVWDSDVSPSDKERAGCSALIRCTLFSVLRADQKGKVRASMRSDCDTLASRSPASDMAFFYQCQSSAVTGEMKGCGFFRLLDCEREGRGPCLGLKAKVA